MGMRLPQTWCGLHLTLLEQDYHNPECTPLKLVTIHNQDTNCSGTQRCEDMIGSTSALIKYTVPGTPSGGVPVTVAAVLAAVVADRPVLIPSLFLGFVLTTARL